jgi:hypothetical protein
MVFTGYPHLGSSHLDIKYREGWNYEDGKGTELDEKNVLEGRS